VATVASKLDEWKRQLLDLSKRNRLLHFKETKRQTLRVEQPVPADLFARIAVRERPATVVGLDTRDALAVDDDGSDAPAGRRPVDVHDGEVLFAGPVDRVANALYTLRSRSRTELEERGVGVLYLAFGFLHWFEADQSEYEIASPIILVPVDLQRETALEPYRLVRRDDDVVLNPTLRKVMEDQFKVSLPDLPDTDSWALAEYLSSVAHATSKQVRWRVEGDAYLSVFSFQKLSMYRDLEAGVSAAEANAIIQALAGDLSLLSSSQGDLVEIPANQLDERVDPAECMQVLDADSSQQQAIELAKAGASFVLQGPPGTGKSQTIANIIAELLGLGRTVLFVSEKAAALDVVHRRLTQAGLADGCLALHSAKANKRDVVAELARVYSLGSGRAAGTTPFNYSRLRERRSALNDYVAQVHAVRMPLAKSVFQVEGLAAAVSDAPEVAFEFSDIVHLTADALETMQDAMARLSGSAEAIDALQQNPWRGANVDGLSVEAQRVTRAGIKEFTTHLSACASSGNQLAELLGLGASGLTPAKADWMCRIARALADGPEFMGAWLTVPALADLQVSAAAAAEQHLAANAEGAQVREVFADQILDYDLDGLALRLSQQYHSIFARLGGAYRRECQSLALLTNSGKRPSFADLSRIIPIAISVRSRRRWVQEQAGRLGAQFGSWYAGYSTDWDALTAALSWTRQLGESFIGAPPESFAERVETILSDRDALRAVARPAENALAAVRSGSRDVAEWFEKDAPTAVALATSEQTSFDLLSQRMGLMESSIDQLSSWTRLARSVETCEQAGLKDVLALLEGSGVSAGEYSDALTCRILTLWLDHWIGVVPALRDFEAAAQARSIDEFRRLDRELMLAARSELAARLASRRPRPSAANVNLASSQPALLMKEAKKKRRHKPLRRLFAEIPDLLVTIKPCMMMSPLSVGQFLPMDSARFDAVVFDEASQVKPEDAVGAIMRGKQLIVVGDSKQLPPTSFFDVSMGDDFDEDDYYDDDAGAFESILDLCGTVGLPERMLEWHYRSRQEGLIAFSNHFLYDDRLVTFPAPSFDRAGTGVESRHVADGVYDRSRSRTNAREVQEVLEIVRTHATTHPDKTLGVVAFSQAQMTAIDTAIWRLRSENPRLEAFFGNSHDEPFFVKNLENVQGDERDVIVFSVGYGRDAAGKLGMNFGPLNNRGGERRLNVAVTRAREKVVLVSSIRGADIDLGRTQSEGVRLLKHYLDYAERGVAALDAVCVVDPEAEFDSLFEEQVALVLERAGYRVHKQVGCSGYRIDLAVVHPDRPGEFAIGIECDGESYHSAATARERDRLREEVLVKLGWRLHRIWSTDWFRSRASESEKLLETVRRAIERECAANQVDEGARSDDRPEAVTAAPMETAQDAPDCADPVASVDECASAVDYCELRLPWHGGDFYSALLPVRRAVVELVQAEGPIQIDRATRRVASAWGIERVGHRVKAAVDFAILNAVTDGFIQSRNGFLYDSGSTGIRVRRNTPSGPSRKASEIAPEEIAEAARSVLQDQIRLSRDDLIVATARVFGFEHTGSLVWDSMARGIAFLTKKGLAVESDGRIRLA